VPPLQRFHLRGPLFVTLSILAFSVAIRPLGLIVSAFVSFMIAAMGSRRDTLDRSPDRRRPASRSDSAPSSSLTRSGCRSSSCRRILQ
jgi:hypothetical protein